MLTDVPMEEEDKDEREWRRGGVSSCEGCGASTGMRRKNVGIHEDEIESEVVVVVVGTARVED